MTAKQFFLTSASVVFAIVLFVYFINLIKSFSDGPEAVDVIGQYNETGYPNPNPLYTSNRVNNLPNLFSLSGSYGQVIDSVNHRLFISDTANNRILVFDLSAGDLLLDHVPDGVLGQANFYTSTANITASGVDQPSGLAYHSVDNLLFVSDYGNNRVLVFDVATITNGEDALYVLGQADFTSNASATTQSGLNGPRDLTLDSINDLLFVTDINNNRVAVFNVSSIVNGQNMVNAVGQYDEVDYSAVNPLYTSNRVDNSPNKLGMNAPTDTAVYESFTGGKLFVSDTNNNRVLVYNLLSHHNFSNGGNDRIPDFVIGQPDFHSNSLGLTADTLNAPTYLAVDSVGGRLFVTDSGNARVLVFDIYSLTSLTNGMSATNVIGQADFTSNGTGISDANINGPQGLDYDASNNLLYLADSNNNRVLVFDVASITNGEPAIHVLGQLDFNSSSSGTTAGTMSAPSGVSFESEHDRLFVADTGNNRVLIYDLTATADGEDAVNVFGQIDFTSSAGDLSRNGMNGPIDVAYFDNSIVEKLYVLDSYNYRILVFNVDAPADGQDAEYVVGQENFTSSNQVNDADGVNNPRGISINSFEDPHLWVADYGLHRVTSFQPGDIVENGIVYYDQTGQFDETNLSDPQTISTTGRVNNAPNMLGLNTPYGVALDTTGHRLFISDSSNNRILGYDLDATNVLVDYQPDYVLGQSNFYSNSANTTIDGLNSPQGIVFDDDNDRLFVSDNGNSRVLVYDVSSVIDGENAINVLSQDNFVSDTPGTTQSKLNYPYSLTYDNTNDYLIVGDFNNNRVIFYNVVSITNGENAVDLIGKYDSTNFTDPVPYYFLSSDTPNALGLDQPVDITIDHVNHRLFAVDNGNHRVLVYNLDLNDVLIDRIPDNVLGQADFSSSGTGTTASTFNHPLAVVFDDVHNILFVSDATNSRVLAFDTTSITNGENAVSVLGQPNFTTSSHAVTQSKMYFPYGLEIDTANNRLFVGDAYNARILVFDISSVVDGEDAVNVLGQPNFTTNSDGTATTKVGKPYGLAYDSTTSKLYSTDAENNRVAVFDVSSITDGEDIVNILGQADFTTNTSGLSQSKFNLPFGIDIRTSDQTLFVTDVVNNRVLVFDVNSITNGENATQVIGQGDFLTGTSGLSQSRIYNPNGVLYDNVNNNIYLADSGNHRILIFDVSADIGGGGGGGGGGGVEPAGITVVQTGGSSTVAENGGTDTFTVVLDASPSSNVVLNISSSNTAEGIVSPTTLTFTQSNFNTPQTITLTGVSDGIIDGTKTYNIVISVVDADSADTYDNVPDKIFTVSTTDSDGPNPVPPTNPPTIPPTIPPTNPPVNPPVNPPTNPPNNPNPNQNPTQPTNPPVNPNPTPPTNPPVNPPINPQNNPSDNSFPITTDGNGELSTAEKIAEDIRSSIKSPIGNATVQIVLFVGLALNLSLAGIGALAANPLGFADIGFRLWSSLLYGFGIRKRNRPWGTVYDSITKQPLDPAYVVLKNLEGKEIANALTDIDGRYGFLVDPGVYAMVVSKSNYHFPSSKLSGKTHDELYSDIYWGDYFEIKNKGEVITRNIPLDRENFSWNEFAKSEQGRMKFFKKRDVILGRLADICFSVGFVVSSVAVINNMSKYNIGIFCLYSVLFFVRFLGINKNKKGKVINRADGTPLSFGIMRIFSASTKTEIAHKVLDGLGNYFCLIPNGKYFATIEKKNLDESYTKVYESRTIEVEGGLLKQTFRV